MLSINEIKKKSQRLWSKLLKSTVTQSSFFPYSIALAPPKSTEIASQFDDIRQWIKNLEAFSEQYQLQLEFKTINNRRLGIQHLPSKLIISESQQLLNLLDRNKDYKFFCENLALIRKQLPELEHWLQKNYRQLETHSGHWPEFISIVKYFQSNPLPDKYLRALDIPNIDSKFIEGHHSIIRQLLNEILSADYVKSEFTETGIVSFCQRFGLRYDQALVRFRWLDDQLQKHTAGLNDISVPVSQFSGFNLPVKQVFITENKTNFLSFPNIKNAAIIFGQGYAINLIANLVWLNEKDIYYWGDIDTHGFNILNQLRKHLPHTRSLLMDRETLLKFKIFWGKENKNDRFTHPLSNLTNEEERLYQSLTDNKLAENLRLEQEKIPLDYLIKNLHPL